MRALALSLLLLLTASLVSAQSLADVARREAQRRQSLKENGKSYTNKDLQAVPQPAPAPDEPEKPVDSAADGDRADSDTPESAPDSGADQRSSDEKSELDDQEVKDQEYWSKRQAALHEQLERDETYAAALQSRIDALTMDFVNRDDPAQRDRIALDRQRAVTELDRLRKAIEQERRAIEDFEEEARRSGVPPGWLR